MMVRPIFTLRVPKETFGWSRLRFARRSKFPAFVIMSMRPMAWKLAFRLIPLAPRASSPRKVGRRQITALRVRQVTISLMRPREAMVAISTLASLAVKRCRTTHLFVQDRAFRHAVLVARRSTKFPTLAESPFVLTLTRTRHPTPRKGSALVLLTSFRAFPRKT